ncbi:MAG: HNH endonuclease [Defluviitaleaceae bacterium]|nr:HNH endonuclease [Defluviitaleaceae bacterium]
MDFQIVKYVRSRTDEELLADIKKVASANNGQLTQKIYNDYRKNVDSTIADSTTICRQIGWSKAVELIGMQKSKYQNNAKISETELHEEILRLWTELGRQPTTTDLKSKSKYPRNKFSARFGSWGDALNKFIQWANSEGFAPPDSTTSELHGRHTSRDVNLRLRYMVLKRDNFKCCSCGRSPAITSGLELHADHITPWVEGGETVLENLQTLCKACNLGKGDMV